MYEGGDGKYRKIFPPYLMNPSKPQNFSPSKLLSFTVSVIGVSARFHNGAKLMPVTWQRKEIEQFFLLLYDHTSDIYHGQYGILVHTENCHLSETLKQHNLLINKLDTQSIKASTPLQKLYDPGWIKTT